MAFPSPAVAAWRAQHLSRVKDTLFSRLCPCQRDKLKAYHLPQPGNPDSCPQQSPRGLETQKGFCGHTSRGDAGGWSGGGDLEIAGF